MKTPRSISTSSRIGFSVLLMLTALAVTPHYAAANTASNTAIINTATVNYKDAGGTAQTAVTASATVTITLVASSPTLNAPADKNTTVNVAANYNTYTITSNANGPDSYNLTIPVKTNSANITASSAVPPASVTLGATTIFTPVTIAAAGTTVITVPSDTVSNASVNGIANGATIVINGQIYTVASIVDNAILTSTITVNGNGAASAALLYGTVIGEQKTFTLAVTPTAMNPTTTDETITTTLSARDSGNLAVAATDITVTTVQGASLTVTKQVSTDGITWGATANAAPLAPLYYRITVHNGGAANATVVVITDPLTPYTTYTPGSGKMVIGAAAAYGGTALSDANPGIPADTYDYTAGTVTYSVATILPGAANDVQLFFKVTIK